MNDHTIWVEETVPTESARPQTVAAAKQKPATYHAEFPLQDTASDLATLGGALQGLNLLSRSQQRKVENERHPSLCSIKRGFDLLVAGTALLILMPVLLLCALAIKLDSEGPVLFWQRRVGRAGRPFSIVKFRTMAKDAEAQLRRYLETNESARREWESGQKLRRDPRITRVGSLMRRFSLDELPQLWNVLIGDMSIVGPRPIQSYEIPIYNENYQYYCAVRPGLTGLWQVSGRSDTGNTRRVLLDCTYVCNWSLSSDLWIVIKTIPAVIKAAGAY